MKKIYLLSLCLGFASIAFAQGKPQFGFVVKAGNYSFPGEKHDANSYSYSSNSLSYNSGSIYTLGIWQSFQLGNHFQLSGELLYRSSRYAFKGHVLNQFEGNYQSEETQKVTESSLSLPIKLHYAFKKEGKAALFIGAGLSRTFITNIHSKSITQSFPFPQVTSVYAARYSDVNMFSTNLSFTTGFHYQLDSKTSLGLEYTFERSANTYFPNTFFPQIPLIDFIYLLPDPRYNPRMNSFSVSLRHNILD